MTAATGERIADGHLPVNPAQMTTIRIPEVPTSEIVPAPQIGWRKSLADAIRDPDELIAALNLPESLRAAAQEAANLFPLLVPQSYLARIKSGDPDDPLLRQVLPLGEETVTSPGFDADPLDEAAYHAAPGMLQKYTGRVLLILTGTCAVHCRYCFRRHYPYGSEPRRIDEWEPAFAQLAADTSISEVLLSGGDPLILSDERLAAFRTRLDAIPHLRRLRIHTRLPIVLPDRITDGLISMLVNGRLTPIVVVHANHAQELQGDCADALRRLVSAGVMVLNQAVLLRGVNDSVESLVELSERLIDLGVLPYYLHQLDRVQGAGHFEVARERGIKLVEAMRRHLPGYAVPKFVQEIPGQPYKVPIL